MEQQIMIPELITKVREEMERLGYSKMHIEQTRRSFARIERYATSCGEVYFSEHFALSFMNDVYGLEVDSLYKTVTGHHNKHYMRYLRMLLEYQRFGVVYRRQRGEISRAVLPPKLQAALDSFNEQCREEGHSEATLYSRNNRIKYFLLFLSETGAVDCHGIGKGSVSDYLKANASLHAKSIQTIATSLRCFLRHIYLEGMTSKDMTVTVPSTKRYYAPSLPIAWKEEEIGRLLNGIDRGNPTGKRDYAILLMVARLGLRASDIKAIRLENLKWDTRTIEITQHKTKVFLTLPILDDIGWALIDYLKNGRPETDSPHVFVRHVTPYQHFLDTSNLTYILVKQMQTAKIPIARGEKTLHSLRHALATSLLKQQVPLQDIVSILGHVSQQSTNIYLHLDDENLRRCALDPEAVMCS
jgi:site-specific recombinase XerD